MKGGKQLGGSEQAAVTGKLDQVLPGVAVRRAENGDKAFVDRVSPLERPSRTRVATREGSRVSVASPDSPVPFPRTTRPATSSAPCPDTRTTAIAERPGGVAERGNDIGEHGEKVRDEG